MMAHRSWVMGRAANPGWGHFNHSLIVRNQVLALLPYLAFHENFQISVNDDDGVAKWIEAILGIA
ncbi:hypothetical protein ACFQEX_12505 [Roseibium salinum]|uniref:hypothetical protein n=1 Tax=Roseibium salinum TaxID=1604349 RepID=UPI003607555C